MGLYYNQEWDENGNIYYFITVNGRGFNDETVSQLLHITLEEYTEILILNSGYQRDNIGYIFRDKESVETALISLKILVGDIV